MYEMSTIVPKNAFLKQMKSKFLNLHTTERYKTNDFFKGPIMPSVIKIFHLPPGGSMEPPSTT